MRQVFTIFCTALLCLPVSAACAEDHQNLKAFPPAKQGGLRYVLQLPHKERDEEGNFRVEIFVGKDMLTDGVNQVRLGATIEARPLEGWGFTYYEVTSFGPAASTLMAVPPGTPRSKQFVSTSKMIPYNSRIPVVIYVPKDGNVRYRIWTAPEKTEAVPEG
ncbi:ecotin family protein [Novipirellula artificiosorum]|nr:ecotin family protein [Novipirellula artificiosorum]